jgi:hypothetical protein
MEKIEIIDSPLVTSTSRHFDCCYYHIDGDICFNDNLLPNNQAIGFIPKCQHCKHYDNDPWDGRTYKQVWMILRPHPSSITLKQKMEAEKRLQQYLKWIRVQIKELKEREEKKKQTEIFQII